MLMDCKHLDCKHSFKNTAHLFCVHLPFEKYCPIFFETLILIYSSSDSSEEEKSLKL